MFIPLSFTDLDSFDCLLFKSLFSVLQKALKKTAPPQKKTHAPQ